jgi:hypothetical protein
MSVLAAPYLLLGIGGTALQAALSVVMGMPPGQTGFFGPAGTYAARVNLMRRAAFMLSCAKRMQTAVVRASSLRDPRIVLDQIAAERRYYGQHLVATWAREQAAAKVDSASLLHGRLLGWNTVITKTTTPECLAADRHNFYADTPPPIGWPGLAHPGCRCYPGAPFPGAPLVGAPRARVQQRAHAYA